MEGCYTIIFVKPKIPVLLCFSFYRSKGTILHSFLGHIRLHIDHFCYNPLRTIFSIVNYQLCSGEWFNGKTAAFKVADLGSNPCSPANSPT